MEQLPYPDSSNQEYQYQNNIESLLYAVKQQTALGFHNPSYHKNWQTLPESQSITLKNQQTNSVIDLIFYTDIDNYPIIDLDAPVVSIINKRIQSSELEHLSQNNEYIIRQRQNKFEIERYNTFHNTNDVTINNIEKNPKIDHHANFLLNRYLEKNLGLCAVSTAELSSLIDEINNARISS